MVAFAADDTATTKVKILTGSTDVVSNTAYDVPACQITFSLVLSSDNSAYSGTDVAIDATTAATYGDVSYDTRKRFTVSLKVKKIHKTVTTYSSAFTVTNTCPAPTVSGTIPATFS